MSDTSALEAQLAFVEDAMRSLDSALAAQQQHIFKLEQQVDCLRQQLNEQGARLDAVAEPGIVCLLFMTSCHLPRLFTAFTVIIMTNKFRLQRIPALRRRLFLRVLYSCSRGSRRRPCLGSRTVSSAGAAANSGGWTEGILAGTALRRRAEAAARRGAACAFLSSTALTECSQGLFCGYTFSHDSIARTSANRYLSVARAALRMTLRLGVARHQQSVLHKLKAPGRSSMKRRPRPPALSTIVGSRDSLSSAKPGLNHSHTSPKKIASSNCPLLAAKRWIRRANKGPRCIVNRYDTVVPKPRRPTSRHACKCGRQ